MQPSLVFCSFVCIRCGKPTQRHYQARVSLMCLRCMHLHRIDGKRATAEVSKAIKSGELDRADVHRCTDCRKPASDWDHRDYMRPLDVEPVCRPCNQRRPTAFDSGYRPAGERQRPPMPISTDRRVRQPALAPAA